MSGNQDLVPIYTEWANRYLSKSGTSTPSTQLVTNIAEDLRDYRLIVRLIHAVVPSNDYTKEFNEKISNTSTRLEGIVICLEYLKFNDVDSANISAKYIESGNLGSILQLVYVLSAHKHKLRELKKKKQAEAQVAEMPPAVATKLPTPMNLGTTPSRTASRIAVPPPTTNGLKAKPTGLKPPAALRPPTATRSSNNNVKSGTSSTCSSIASSGTYASIPSVSPTPPTGIRAPSRPPSSQGNLTTSQITKRSLPVKSTTPKLANVKTIKNTPPKAPPVTTKQPETSSMLKLKLFSKKPAAAAATATTTTTTAAVKSPVPAAMTKSGLKPPTSKIATVKRPAEVKVRNTISVKKPTTEAEEKKRCSKSSEESAYVSMSNRSPASSTEGSISMHSQSSKEGESPDSTEPSSSTAVFNNKQIVEEKPTLAVRGVSKEEKSPTVGVVSPMLNQRKKIEEKKEKTDKKPPLPTRDSRLETTFTGTEPPQTVQVPKMAPIKQPPSYKQLLQQGRISAPQQQQGFGESSDDSLDSVTTTIRMKQQPSSAGNTLDRPTTSRTNESSGYASETGGGMFTRMKEKMKELDSHMKPHLFRDSFDDSSSLSSGISENIEDISTDDLSGTDMASVAAYGKTGDYHQFCRSSSSTAKSMRGASSSVDSRSRRMAEQENIHKLLSQCRTSQRGAAAATSSSGPQQQHQHILTSPGYATISGGSPNLTLSADGDTLSVHSLRHHKNNGSLSGFHSLDRKAHLQDYLSPRESRGAMAALVSPRRTPNRSSPPTGGSMSARTAKDYGIYAAVGDGIHLHRLNDELHKSPSRLTKSSEMGSQLSVASCAIYASLNDKYEAEMEKLARELNAYQATVSKLTRKQEDYALLFDVFDVKLSNLSQNIEKSQLKPDEVTKLRQDIIHLKQISSRLASKAEQNHYEGAGELLRQPSLESVASHRSSMSSSSKSSKTDKSSLNSFGKSKKSWIRSSLTKAFSKKKKSGAMSDNEGSPMHRLDTITGSQSRLDDIEVNELRRQLEDRDLALTDVRLDALDRARQVDVLRETINKLKSENKQLKQDMTKLMTIRSRASSHASIPMMLNEEEPFYETACNTSTSPSNSYSSKRSSGCNSIKVTVNVDLKGGINDRICPDNEIIVGYLPVPCKQTTWVELDQQLSALFQVYLDRIDSEHQLDLTATTAIIGYQMGDVHREPTVTPEKAPEDVLSPTTTIRMFLRGARQDNVDSLVLDTLLPREMLHQLVKYLTAQRRLVLAGATGIGKSKLARELTTYISYKNGLSPDSVIDIKVPDEGNEKLLKVEKQLEQLLYSKSPAVILIDNIPKNKIAFVASVFANVPLGHDEGPFVICTVNRYQLPEMKVHQNFKMFLLTNRMDGVNGFMSRFLRRRAIETEFRQCRQMPSELGHVIAFLPKVLEAVNSFIEKTNSMDVTIGPRVFLQLPLMADETRPWFIKLWNENFVPYMEKVAREGKKNFGKCSTFDDPTDTVCEHWPWLEGPPAEESLKRLNLKDLVPTGNTPKTPFNPLESLMQLHATKHGAQEL